MKKWILSLILIAAFVVAPLHSAFSAALDDKAITAGGGRAYFEIYDEDDMSSDDPYGFATQQSIKAYADGADRDITGTRSHSASVYLSGTSPVPVAKIGYTLTGLEGNTFYIDATATGINLDECEYGVGPTDGAGVTVYLPTPTEALAGHKITLVKIDSGSTDIFAAVSGTSGMYKIDSGTTDGSTDDGTYAVDAQYDWITFELAYIDSGTSPWVIVGRGIDGSNK